MGELLGAPIVGLDDRHDRTAFSSGAETLDRYLRLQAGQDQRRHVAACFVLIDPSTSRIAGYYTLSALSVALHALPQELQKRLPHYPEIPCTLLGRLAVDRQYRAQGLGGYLLADALKRALHSSREIASWAVVVDAKDAAAAAFYARHRFTALGGVATRLFLPMRTIAKSAE